MADLTPTGKTSAVRKTAREAQLEEERMREVLMLVDNLLRREETTLALVVKCLFDVGSVNLINQKLQNRPLNGIAKWIAHLSKPIFTIVALRWIKKNCPQLITRWLHNKVKFEAPKAKVKPAATVSPQIAAVPAASATIAPETAVAEAIAPEAVIPEAATPAIPTTETPAPEIIERITIAPAIAAPEHTAPEKIELELLESSNVELTATHHTPAIAAPDPPPQAPILLDLENTNREITRLRSQVRVLTAMLIGVSVTFGATILWISTKPQTEARLNRERTVTLEKEGDRFVPTGIQAP